MDADTYQRLAARTLIDGPGFEISDRDMMVVWCMTGAVGEAGELNCLIYGDNRPGPYRVDTDKIGREVGDCCWYLAGLCTKLGLSFGDVLRTATTLPENLGGIRLLKSSASIAELVKKGIFHQHGLDVDAVREQIVISVRCLMSICDNIKISFGDIMAENIDKLKARYPDGWDAGRSGIRDGEAR